MPKSEVKLGTRKRYAIVGTGVRATMFVDALAGAFQEHAQLVALCDVSSTRMAWHNRRLGALFKHPPVPTFPAADFDRMIQETKPAAVIVCTLDGTHHQYIIRAMELGCDVICEKPMTIDAEKARAIFSAIDKTGKKLRVTFNYRYAPAVTKVKELIRQGVIGRPLAVDFNWILDTSHGADYFRRWHREKDKSGGLLVHKATHHFDLINWWIESSPRTVFAMGDLKFYGRHNAIARGDQHLTQYERYTQQPRAKSDPFALFLNRQAGPDDLGNDASLRGLYLDAEQESGYVRDRNVFGDGITIEDTMAVIVRYRNNVIMSYSLLAYSPWEGYRVSITGDRGRLELFDKHGSHIITREGDPTAVQPHRHEQSLQVFPMFATPYEVKIDQAAGGHGGGDPIMLQDILLPDRPADPFGRAASHLDGAASILVGISANQSIRSGQPVECDRLLALPD